MSGNETTNLKCCLLNAENLFLTFDQIPTAEALKIPEAQWQKLTSSTVENKPLKKCLDMAKGIQDINADILMLCEVGGYESLNNFNHLFLNDAYSVYLVEGNSERNIDVGFLIKKELPYFFDLQSNKNRLINYLYPHERLSIEKGYPVKGGKVTTSHKFSRDVVELRLFKADREKPFMIVLLTHLKSRLDPDGIDPNGFERRQAELKALIEIYGEISLKHQGVPIIVAGDFNGNASFTNTDSEFKEIYANTQLKDVFEHLNIPHEERATFYQVKSGSRTDGRQIDFVFLPADTAGYLKEKAYVYRYKDEFGMAHGIPMNMDAKLRLPSDHYPIVFELEGIPVK
jgi:Exonuclease III